MAGHKEPKRLDTRFVHGGSHPERFDGAVNTPVYRFSTAVSSTVEEMRHRAKHPPGVLAYGRASTSWSAKGPTIRLHVGLEDPIDLIADLDQAMAAMTSASVER